MQGLMTEENKALDVSAKQALAYVTSKHNDILILCEAIATLRQMFVDLSVLVERQGEVINRIEENCEKALDYVKEGTEDLVQANEYSKGSSKILIIILIVVIIITLVMVVAIVVPTVIDIVTSIQELQNEDDWNPNQNQNQNQQQQNTKSFIGFLNY